MSQTSTEELLSSQYLSFHFATDESYQQGLTGILANPALEYERKSADQQAQILRQSRVFYFNSVTGNSITAEDALKFEQSVPSSQLSPPAEEPATLTFAQLKELIEQGKTENIPNNRIIPDNISEDSPSNSTAPIRRKPWESVESTGEIQKV